MFYFIREAFLFIMTNLFDITLAAIAWLFLQLPIFTGPGATIGLFYFARQALLQGEAQFNDFIHGLKAYFWKSWLIVLPSILLILVLVYDIAFFLSAEQWQARLLASMPMAMLSLLLVMQTYVFVFFAWENASWAAVKKAFTLAMAELPFTVALMVFVVLYFLALYVTKIGLVLIFVGPVAVLQSKAVHYLLTKRGIEF